MELEKDRGDTRPGVWKVLFIAFAAAGGVLLVMDHQAQVFGAIPYLLLLACPLMHFFGHCGHHRSAGQKGTDIDPNRKNDKPQIHGCH